MNSIFLGFHWRRVATGETLYVSGRYVPGRPERAPDLYQPGAPADDGEMDVLTLESPTGEVVDWDSLSKVEQTEVYERACDEGANWQDYDRDTDREYDAWRDKQLDQE